MFGTKADNLYKLKSNGFNVPPFTVITFDEAFDNDPCLSEFLKNHIDKTESELSALLKEHIGICLKTDFKVNADNESYAVRSCANAEDGFGDSFAGQFDTYLNVYRENLNERIRDCFKSLYNENVLTYIKKRGIPAETLRMNVIVQKMVQSEQSGIIFTANPMGILNEAVITVGEGLGENVVSDKTDTTSYYYNLSDNVYYYEGAKNILDRHTIDELINLSRNIIPLFGKYLDIEFGICNNVIYVLQVRNITTLDDSNPLILDNSNIVESYPGISLPLTVSFVNSVYSGVFKGVSYRILKSKKELAKHESVFKNMVGSANGRIYYKISNWYTVIKFLPFSEKIIPVWQEMLGVGNKSYDSSKVELSPFRRAMTYFNSVYELLSVPRNMKMINRCFTKINEEFYSEFPKAKTARDILRLYGNVEEKLLSCWDITLLNDTYAFIFTGLLKARLKSKYENYEEIANNYISGMTNIESLKPIREMIALAYEKDSLSQSAFEKRFFDYIKLYGDRNLEELKLESLTFRTNPELLLDKIEEYRKDLQRLGKSFADMNSSSKTDTSNEDFLTKLFIKKCMSGIMSREISRLNRSRIYGMARESFLRLGQIYKSYDYIENARDVFYLTLDELKALSVVGSDMKNTVNSRKKAYEAFSKLPAYSRLVFSENEFDKHHASINSERVYSDENELHGTPCSNGIVRGKALVINNPSEAKDVKDKILITKMTDPGWVFLLASANGVAAEKGSLLSHTAIISRELKIPSVVGVKNLLDAVRTGDEIEINGTEGTVKIIRKCDNL
ncbi:MAG: phosphoenolpyruvate synthase [Clostridia bacterium]|nr:phosphoenolpyruvate synthase [Clostridia bacterium]